MTDFHATHMGRRFYESTLPELVAQLRRLNENLERFIDRTEYRPQPHDTHAREDEAEESPPHA